LTYCALAKDCSHLGRGQPRCRSAPRSRDDRPDVQDQATQPQKVATAGQRAMLLDVLSLSGSRGDGRSRPPGTFQRPSLSSGLWLCGAVAEAKLPRFPSGVGSRGLLLDQACLPIATAGAVLGAPRHTLAVRQWLNRTGPSRGPAPKKPPHYRWAGNQRTGQRG